MKRLCAILIILLGSLSLSCTSKHVTLLPHSPYQETPMRDLYVVTFIIDGGIPDAIDAGVQDGSLPHFKEFFYDEGARFDTALSVFPTVSTPGHQAILSGLEPGHHGMPSLEWLSRPNELFTNALSPKGILQMNIWLFNFLQIYKDAVYTDEPNLFFNELKGHPSLSIFETFNQGASHIWPSAPPILTLNQVKRKHRYEVFDRVAMNVTLRKFKKVKPKNFPRFTVVALYGMDNLNHDYGAKSPRAKNLYVEYDQFLGKLKKVLEKKGIWEKTVLVVTSDHGHHPISQWTNLKAHLKKIGLNTTKKLYYPNQAIWCGLGTGSSGLYLKKGDDWLTRPSYQDLQNYTLTSGKKINLINDLLSHPDIEWLIAPEGPWIVHVFRKNQHALIKRRLVDGKFFYHYEASEGHDPLGYLTDPTLKEWTDKKQFKDAEQWLSLTYNKAVPDSVVAFSQIFDDYRAGDLFIATIKESEFHKPRVSTHGSPFLEDRHVPLMFHGPYIKKGTYAYARITDIYPTLLALLGLESVKPLDGEVRNIFTYAKKSPQRSKPAGKMTSLSVEAFQKFLREKLASKDLNKHEIHKAKQLLYSIHQFLVEKDQYPMP